MHIERLPDVTDNDVDQSVLDRRDAAIKVAGRLALSTTSAPYSSASFGALHDVLSKETIPELSAEAIATHKAYFLGLVAMRPQYSPLNIAREYQRSLQAHILWRKHLQQAGTSEFDENIAAFPLGMNKVDAWYPQLEKTVDEIFDRPIFRLFLSMNTNSNIASRGAAVTLTRAVVGETGEYSMVEFGTACLGIPKKLKKHREIDDLKFAPISVVEAVDSRGETLYVPQKRLSRQITNTVHTYDSHLGYYLGADIQDSREPMISAKSRGSSFYTEELANDWQRLKEWDALDALVPTVLGLDFELMDVSEPLDFQNLYEKHPRLKQGVDIVLASFIAYELGSEKSNDMISNMLNLLHDNGKAILIDEATITPEGNLTFNQEWGKFGTRIMVYDKSRPELGWQTFFTSENGRIRRIIGETALLNYKPGSKLGIQPTRLATSV